MKNNTALPVIEFAEGNTYDALHSLLYLADKALGGSGITWHFHLEDGQVITGSFVSNQIAEVDGDWWDTTTIARMRLGEPNVITVLTDDIVRIVYA